jgi:TonB dependent receptor
LYTNLNYPPECILTLGISYDDYIDQQSDIKTVSPKTGLQCAFTSWLSGRAAAFKSVKPALLANQTIQPTQLATFNQFFDDFNGTRAWRFGAGLDAHLLYNLYAGAEISFRELDQPSAISRKFSEDRDESLYRGYLYWTPYQGLAIRGAVEYDLIDSESAEPTRAKTWSVPLGVQYFHPSGIFAGAGTTYVNQQVKPLSESPEAPEGTESFLTIDAALGYRFPERRGVISVEARNLTDKRVKFQDDQFRTRGNVFAVSPFFPERAVFLLINLSW